MTTATDRTARGAPVRRTESPTTFPDDQLYMLKLCLELQLEALLLALGSSVVSTRGRSKPSATRSDDLPWQKWLAEDLELACALTRDCVEDGVPLPSSMGIVGTGPGGMVESLAARYSAMAAVVDEMLDRTDAREHTVAVQRLHETRMRCSDRLDALLGEAPHAQVHLIPPSAEAGHYLG